MNSWIACLDGMTRFAVVMRLERTGKYVTNVSEVLTSKEYDMSPYVQCLV